MRFNHNPITLYLIEALQQSAALEKLYLKLLDL
jgi:hypothetical protein